MERVKMQKKYVKLDMESLTYASIYPGKMIPVEPVEWYEVKIPENPTRFDTLLIEGYSLDREDPFYLYKDESDIQGMYDKLWI